MPYTRDGLVMGWLLLCMVALGGCGAPHSDEASSLEQNRALLSLVDFFAFTGFSGVSIDLADLARTDPVGCAEQLMYGTDEYQAARRMMDAKGLETFSSMVMLVAGGCERSRFVWAFKRNGTVSCLTSLDVRELGVPAKGCTDGGEGFVSQATLADDTYESAMGDLARQARKGAYSVGATGEYIHGVRLHVVAYDRDRNFFLRATTVDEYVTGAILEIIDLQVFEPGMGKQEVLDRWEKTFATLTLRATDSVPRSNAEIEYEVDHKRFVKLIAENWDKCLPFLVAKHLVNPQGSHIPASNRRNAPQKLDRKDVGRPKKGKRP